jgi:hypothetical protein
MFLPLSEGLPFSPAHQRLLRSLVIDEQHPGALLHDFEALLAFLKERELPLTASHQLPLRALADLNTRLAHPLQLGLKRPQQKSYPPIHGLYLLVRASGLTYVRETGPKPVVVVDDEVHPAWSGLNPTEQYGWLLETWLLRGHPEILGERGRGLWLIPENFREMASFYLRLPSDGLVVAGNREAEEWLTYSPGWHNLGLLALFGFIRVQDGVPEPGQGWRIERIHRTPVGDALLAALYNGFFAELDRLFQLEDTGQVPFGVLQSVLQPYLPAWKNTLPLPEWTFRDGTYRFKAALGPIWRRMAIGGQHLLDDLADLILDSVDFDRDHLYRFSYRNRFGFMQDINHPYLEEGLFTSEVRVGDVPLRVGQTMTFLFDFGDQWEFAVTLEEVDSDRAIRKPRLLETHGPSPEQYPTWDDEEE